MPIFDSIRDAIRGAGQRISADPWEAADLFLPGNMRQGGQWNPAGIAAGIGQITTGVPAALSQGVISGMFRGGQVPRPNAIRDNQAAGVPRIPSVIPRDEQGNAVRDEVDPRIPMGEATGPSTGPRLGRGESTGGGNMGGVTLGLGQLGRGGDEAIAAHVRSLFTRRGTQAES